GGAERLPPGGERVRHHRPSPDHAQRVFRILPAVVETAVTRHGAAPRRHDPHPVAVARVRYVVVRNWAQGTVWGPLLDRSRAAPLRYVGTYGGDVLYEVPAGAR